MNAVEKLLMIDKGAVKKNEGTCKVYLSRVGESIDFKIKEVDAERYTELMEQSLKFDEDGNMEFTTYNQKIFMIIEGCDTFQDDRLLKHFDTTTPKELIGKIMTNGEIDTLHKAISKLSGHRKIGETDKDIVDKVKN